MVQGTKKIISKSVISSKSNLKSSAKHTQKVMKLKKKTKKGTPLQLPRGKFRDEALDDRALSKAIDKASEVKVAAKLVQDGGKINSIKDTMIKGNMKIFNVWSFLMYVRCLNIIMTMDSTPLFR